MAVHKEKILILVDWFAPGYKAGGPIRSSLNVAFALKDNYDVHVLTTDTDHGETQPYKDILPNRWITNIDDRIKIYYAKKTSLTVKQLKAVIFSVAPKYIYLNHIYSPKFVLYPLWLKFSGLFKGKVIVCPRGGLYDTAVAVKSYKKTPLLKLMRWLNIQKHVTFHATNEREKQAIETFFPGSNTLIADNLPGLNQPPYVSCLKVPGSVKCVFIARIMAIKNLLYLLKVLQSVQAEVLLTVIGPIENEEYWNECKKVIEELPVHIKVEYKGSKQNQELLKIIQEHHLYILPTVGENFGYSIFEALQMGRPILISDQTPWLGLPEKHIGWDVPLSQPQSFACAIEEAAGWNQDEFDLRGNCAWEYAREFSEAPGIKQKYFQLFS